ncbi:MAG: preprotein translocase subunit YajC [Pseudomonadota bacterium]
MLENLFMGTAHAMAGQSAQGGGQGNFLVSLLPLVLIFGIFYFLLIRPQQKQQKRVQEMLSNLKRGDKVVTRGGIHGKIDEIKENGVIVEVAQNLKLTLNREAIASIVNTNTTQGE